MNNKFNNKVVVSGIQPSGIIHIGNYLGAFKNFLKLQNDYKCFFFIADFHSLTVPQDRKKLNSWILELMATFLALGLNPEKSVLFVQSFVPAHTELTWILSTLTPLSFLKEMHQFKEKAKKQGKDVNAGLFTYPILQSADVLLYDADFVPVGQDQIQHIELIRDLAKKFNEKYDNTFKIPQPLINKNTAKIMSLKDPTKKMSKSDQEKTYIGIFESPDVIKEKIIKATTDSGTEIFFDPIKKPAISNLLLIASGILDTDMNTTVKIMQAPNYMKFKEKLAQLIIDYFQKIKIKKEKLLIDEKELKKIFIKGAAQAQEIAMKKIIEIKKKIGLLVKDEG